MHPDRLDQLAEFPFRRLAALLEGIAPGAEPTADLALGEPKHAPPAMLA
jgi:N-succinyldiaminopimelate aminotransferase